MWLELASVAVFISIIVELYTRVISPRVKYAREISGKIVSDGRAFRNELCRIYGEIQEFKSIHADTSSIDMYVWDMPKKLRNKKDELLKTLNDYNKWLEISYYLLVLEIRKIAQRIFYDFQKTTNKKWVVDNKEFLTIFDAITYALTKYWYKDQSYTDFVSDFFNGKIECKKYIEGHYFDFFDEIRKNNGEGLLNSFCYNIDNLRRDDVASREIQYEMTVQHYERDKLGMVQN